MAELTRAQFDGHRKNLALLIDGGASDGDVDFYLRDNKVTAEQLQTPPDFVGIPEPIIPSEATALKLDPTAFRVGGALLGGSAGAPLAPVTGGLSILGGAALVGEGAGQAAELFNKFVLGQRDERTPVERGVGAAVNIATDVGLSGIGGAAVPAVRGALSSIINPVRNRLSGQGAAANLRDFAEAGIPPSAGAVTGNRLLQGTEQALSRLPSSARTMQVQAAKQQAALADELERIATGAGTARTSFTAGRRIVEGVESFAGNVRVKGKELFNAIPIRKDTPVDMADTRAFINDDLQAFANAPELQGMVVSPKLQGILAAIERNGGQLTWEQTKRLRTAIGDQISDPRLISDSGTAELKRLYGALTGDMERAASTQGDRALTAWRRASGFWRAGLSRLELIEPVIRSPQAERAFNAALSGAREGPTLLRAIRKSIPREQWGDFTAAMLTRMGKANPGAQDAAGEIFSARTYLTNWNRLAPEAKNVLFGTQNQLRRNLNRLSRVTASFRDIDAMANPSGTSGQNVFMQLLQGQVGSIPGIAAGSVTGAVAGFAVATGGPLLTAKLMTSNSFIKWLTKGVQISATNFNGIGAHLGRLAAIKSREPEIAEDIERMQSEMRTLLGVQQANL